MVACFHKFVSENNSSRYAQMNKHKNHALTVAWLRLYRLFRHRATLGVAGCLPEDILEWIPPDHLNVKTLRTARHFERPATSLSSERIFGLVVILAMWKCAETWKSLMKKLLSDKNMFFVNLAGTTHLGMCIQAEESTATCVFPFLLRMRRTSQIALPECLRPVIAIDHATCASWNSKLELGNQSHPSQRREADVFFLRCERYYSPKTMNSI